MTADEIHQHPMAALDKLRALARELRAADKAHTPTDDEREALRIAHLDARQAAYREDRALWFRDYDNAPEIATNAFFRGWDAAVDGGFRRSEHAAFEPQGEPSDAQVDPWIPHARRALHIHDTWGTPDDPDGKTRPMSDYTELSARMANTLRAALAATEEGGNTDV
ncbi:hypothetical protein L687_12340 [Microbacterium maritypicum MF109]|uniref:Uncharacterized protein n=2 Tax=Microbacterium maritypicum TaxID=33918 RepID=T5KWL2_MICMQ|nr:hypothetical protein L687_12340 [Microbacterium maritypicum MF109]